MQSMKMRTVFFRGKHMSSTGQADFDTNILSRKNAFAAADKAGGAMLSLRAREQTPHAACPMTLTDGTVGF